MPTMPNVVGLEYPAALASMVAAGVRVIPLGYFQSDPVMLNFVKNASVKAGFVISQVPASGTPNVAVNSVATLTVSNYPVSVAYPAGGGNT
jgi:beta-lactam-binding protein with PASTA domain